MLQKVLYRASRRGFTAYYYNLETLAEKAQYELFRPQLLHFAASFIIVLFSFTVASYLCVLLLYACFCYCVACKWRYPPFGTLILNKNKDHCLNHLYAVKLRPSGAVRLRARGHHDELPAAKFDFNKRIFIVRSRLSLCVILSCFIVTVCSFFVYNLNVIL